MLKLKTCNSVVVVTVFLLALFCCTPVYADDTSLGRTPEGVFPMQENDVIMESEEITVDLEKNSVECIFVFHNTGESKNVFMGFPGKLYHEEDGLTDAANLELYHFKTFVKGKELHIAHEKSTKNIDSKTSGELRYSEYFTFTVPFKAGEKVTVRNTYDFFPTYDSLGDVFSGYVLKTGAMWKDAIGSAKVTFKLGSIQPYELTKIKPGGFKFVKNELVWERKNFEPTYDLQIEYNTYRYRTEFLGNITDDENKLKLEIKQKIDSYNKIKELANKGKTGELLALYKKAIEERDSIRALYIRTYLPSDKIYNEISDESTILGDIRVDFISEKTYEVSCGVQGAEPANLELNISHFENGIKIIDVQENIFSCYVDLKPGVEYTITYLLTDWLDQTEQKILKFKAPEKSEEPVENQTQTSVADESSSRASSDDEPVNAAINEAVSKSTNETSSELKNDSTKELVSKSSSDFSNESDIKPANESINKSSNDSINESSNKSSKESTNESVIENSDGTKLIFWMSLGIIVVGISVLSVMMLSRKEQD